MTDVTSNNSGISPNYEDIEFSPDFDGIQTSGSQMNNDLKSTTRSNRKSENSDSGGISEVQYQSEMEAKQKAKNVQKRNLDQNVNTEVQYGEPDIKSKQQSQNDGEKPTNDIMNPQNTMNKNPEDDDEVQYAQPDMEAKLKARNKKQQKPNQNENPDVVYDKTDMESKKKFRNPKQRNGAKKKHVELDPLPTQTVVYAKPSLAVKPQANSANQTKQRDAEHKNKQGKQGSGNTKQGMDANHVIKL